MTREATRTIPEQMVEVFGNITRESFNFRSFFIATSRKQALA